LPVRITDGGRSRAKQARTNCSVLVSKRNDDPDGGGVWPMNSSKAASWSGEAVV